jgi:hypothetical protein
VWALHPRFVSGVARGILWAGQVLGANLEVIRGRIASSWTDFGSALGGLPFSRHVDLISQIRVSTGNSRAAFLQLQTDKESRTKADRKRRKKENDGGRLLLRALRLLRLLLMPWSWQKRVLRCRL